MTRPLRLPVRDRCDLAVVLRLSVKDGPSQYRARRLAGVLGVVELFEAMGASKTMTPAPRGARGPYRPRKAK